MPSDTTPIKAPEKVTPDGIYYCAICGDVSPDPGGCKGPIGAGEHRPPVARIEYRPAHHTVSRKLAVELAEAQKTLNDALWDNVELEPVWTEYHAAEKAVREAQSSGLLEPEETGAVNPQGERTAG